MAKQEKPERMNLIFDHSKSDLYQAVGIREDQLKAVKRMIDKTCCGMEKQSEAIEHWCDILSKKEMALIIKNYRHQLIDHSLKNQSKESSSNFDSFLDMFFSNLKKEKESSSVEPNKDNDIYRHDKKDLKFSTGISYEEILSLVDRLNEKIRAKGVGNTVVLAELINKNSTHKEVSLLYAVELAKSLPANNISSFIERLFKDGRE